MSENESLQRRPSAEYRRRLREEILASLDEEVADFERFLAELRTAKEGQ